jgi:hypothetical protein
MKRRWNWLLWVGFFLVLAGVLSYIPFFALFPLTRDFPWASLLLFCTGGMLLGVGLMRAFRKPELYRGRVFGSILAVLSAAAVSLFSYGIFYEARRLPSASSAPRVGQKAPDFTLQDQNGKRVSLADLLSPPPANGSGGRANGAVLIFYRGYW